MSSKRSGQSLAHICGGAKLFNVAPMPSNATKKHDAAAVTQFIHVLHHTKLCDSRRCWKVVSIMKRVTNMFDRPRHDGAKKQQSV